MKQRPQYSIPTFSDSTEISTTISPRSAAAMNVCNNTAINWSLSLLDLNSKQHARILTRYIRSSAISQMRGNATLLQQQWSLQIKNGTTANQLQCLSHLPGHSRKGLSPARLWYHDKINEKAEAHRNNMNLFCILYLKKSIHIYSSRAG